MDIWEWPGPNGHKCNAVAIDLSDGLQVECGLRFNHRPDQHHWEETVKPGESFRSISWMATGPITYVGKPLIPVPE